MFFLSDWASPDRRELLHFTNDALEAFKSHRQLGEKSPEGGGLLLGKVRGDHLEILVATTPTLNDRRSRYFFERRPNVHAELADMAWVLSNGLVRYLGDWHTHPQDLPIPSSLDRTEWRALASKRQDRRPVLAVIAGRRALHVELVNGLGEGTVFTAVPP